MTRFPGNDFTDFEAPMRVEADIAGLEVIQGEVPEHLSGIYYRVVCDRQWPSPVEDDFFFNEDGMAMYFRFHKGRVDFRSRYVRTPRYQSENEAGRALFGAYRNPLTDDPSVQGMRRGLANTNVFFHGGKLYASKEDSPPLLLDPMTLETVGEDTFEGALTSETCTAHPKTDARTGEMVFFGYAAKGETTPDIAYYEADPSGKVVHEAWITPPYSSMVHDFAVTQNFVIFPIIPLRSEHEWLERGEPHFKWDPDKDVYLGVLPRKGTAKQLRWFRAPNRFASHIMGAHDDGRNIHIDTPVSTGNFFTFFPDVTGAPWDPDAARGYLSRWSVDMGGESDTFTERKLMPYPGSSPAWTTDTRPCPTVGACSRSTTCPARSASAGGSSGSARSTSPASAPRRSTTPDTTARWASRCSCPATTGPARGRAMCSSWSAGTSRCAATW